MPLSVAIAIAVAQIIVTIAVALYAAKRGVAQGVSVALAVYAEKFKHLEDEVVRLRTARHDHAQFLTRHEAEIDYIKARMKV